jgi:MazG family protein
MQEKAHQSTPRSGCALDRSLALVEFLRAHCPWDAAQTPVTLLRHLVEETHEVVDAIAREDDAALRDELGDLLLNLAFQIVLGEERAGLDREAVVARLEDKMRRRHPHLFGLGAAEPWEIIKARERAAKQRERAEDPRKAGLLAELPTGLDPLVRAHRMQQLVARAGFDWPDALGAWEKVREEVDEVRAELELGDAAALEAELGDLLFSVVNLARLADVYAPGALARTNAKFVRRFEELERLAGERGERVEEMGLEALDTLWDEIKRSERDGHPSTADR